MRRSWILTTLTLAVGWAFFISSAGIVSTNDGSHFALTRALVDTHSFVIDPYIEYTAAKDRGEIPPPEAYLDLSYRAGHFYSDRGPGTAFLATPFYLGGLAMERAGIGDPMATESSVTLLSALAGAILFLAVYGLSRELGARFVASLVTALLVAFGTLAWTYSTVLYSHALSATLVAGAAFLMVRWARSTRSRGEAPLIPLAGLLLGYSVVVEYTALILLAPFGLYLLLQRARVRDWAWAIAGVAPPLVVLAFYDRVNFGSFLTTSYSYQYHFAYARSLATTYVMPVTEGLKFYITGVNGIFAVSPFLLLSLVGLALLARRKWPEAVLLFGSFLILLIPISMHRIPEDARYMLITVPLLATPLSFFLEEVMAARRSLFRFAGWTAATALGAFSVLRSFLSLQSMFGHLAVERSWTSALNAVLTHFSLAALLPRLDDSAVYLIVVLALALACGAAYLAREMLLLRSLRPRRLQTAISVVCLIAIAGGLSTYYRAEANGSQEANEARLLAAGSNLLSNGGFEASESTGPLDGWRASGVISLAKEGHNSPHAVSVGPGTAELESALVYVNSGRSHGLTWYSRGEGAYWVDFVWDKDQREVLGVDSARYRSSSGWQMNNLSFVAPLPATGLRVRFRDEAGMVYLDDVRLAQAGVRVEPLASYGKAALAFTFDWETAMGGAIHSRGEANPTYESATGHGLLMRQGAENLLKIFQRYDVRGTFYATGYNLLDGNTSHRQFSGDPTYRWASAKNGWPNDFWTTHPWYSFDPFGTYQTEPAWYFGDLVDKMRSQNQDVQTHTFGHLYVRGTTPEQLKTDLEQWNQAAKDKGLEPAKTFAFPWRSSNSVKLPHYQVLADEGIQAVTRLYQYADPFELGSITTTPSLLTYPDEQLESTAEGQKNALKAIDTVLARRGFTSLWTHPEEVVDAGTVGIWNQVVAYAASKREQGLVVDSLTNIVDHYLAVRKLKVDFSQSGAELAIAVKNTGEEKVDGATLTLPGVVKKATIKGGQPLSFQRDQVLLPALQPGAGLEITVTLQ